MKYMHICLIFILISITTVFSQELIKQQLQQVHNNLRKGGEEIKYPLQSYLHCDFEFDSNEQIYIANPYERNIQIFNSDGKQNTIIKVAEKHMRGFEILMMEISLDHNDNIVCLLTKNGAFINLLYIQKEDHKIIEITLNQKIDGEIRKFYLNSDDKLYFNTFPWVLDYTGESLGNNYVFEKNGEFICRTDYFVTTTNLKRIKFVYTDKHTIISQFAKNAQKIMNCIESIKVNELTLENEYEPTKNISRESWWYIGYDYQSNIYIANSSKILKIDSNLNIEKEYKYSSEKDHLKTNYRSLRVSPKGSLFSLNISSKKGKSDSRYTADEVIIHIIKIK